MNTLTTVQMAERCGVAPCVIRGWADRGLVPCRLVQRGNRSGSDRVFDVAEIEEWIARTGLPDKKSKGYPLHRLWALVRQDGSGCWLYTGPLTPAGYGSFHVSGTDHGAHRFMYEAVKGPIPTGLHLDHLCRRPACLNPWHLEAVTPAENLRRGNGFAGVNARKTVCVNGHEFTPENTYRDERGRHCRRCHADNEARRRDRLRAEGKWPPRKQVAA